MPVASAAASLTVPGTGLNVNPPTAIAQSIATAVNAIFLPLPPAPMHP